MVILFFKFFFLLIYIDYLTIIKKTIENKYYSVKELRIPSLLHFVYKSIAQCQLTYPKFETPYNTNKEKKRYLFNFFNFFKNFFFLKLDYLGMINFLITLINKKIEYIKIYIKKFIVLKDHTKYIIK